MVSWSYLFRGLESKEWKMNKALETYASIMWTSVHVMEVWGEKRYKRISNSQTISKFNEFLGLGCSQGSDSQVGMNGQDFMPVSCNVINSQKWSTNNMCHNIDNFVNCETSQMLKVRYCLIQPSMWNVHSRQQISGTGSRLGCFQWWWEGEMEFYCPVNKGLL